SGSSFSLREAWTDAVTSTSGAISASVPPHGTVVFRVSGGTPIPANRIQGVGSGRCLDVAGVSQANGAPVQIWDCHGQSNQQWTATAAGELRVYGSKCLDVNNNGTADGTSVIIWDCNGQDNQKWRFNQDGSITAAGAGRCLDGPENATANGVALNVGACNGGANQGWNRLWPVHPGTLPGLVPRGGHRPGSGRQAQGLGRDRGAQLADARTAPHRVDGVGQQDRRHPAGRRDDQRGAGEPGVAERVVQRPADARVADADPEPVPERRPGHALVAQHLGHRLGAQRRPAAEPERLAELQH